MANRYADNIRRIVGKDDTDGSLAEAKTRERLLGGRGVGYISGSGGQVATSSGFTGDGSFGPTGVSANNPQGDSSTSTSGNGGSTSGGVSDGREPLYDPSNPFSFLSYLSDKYGNPNTTDVKSTMTDWTYNSLDALKIISGKDPATGKDVEIYLGSLSYPPPDGWDDPDVPPSEGPDPTWQLGYYWEHLYANVNDKFATPTEAHDAFVAQHTADQAAFNNVYEYDPVSQVSISQYQSCFRQIVSNGNPIPPGPTACIDIARFACGGGDPNGPGDYCTIVAPGTETPEFWPPIDKIVMNFENGIASLSDYQNPADTVGFTQNGHSIIHLESATNPGTYYTIEPSGTGGTLIYETSTPGGAPIGVYKTFDALGQFTGFGDVSSIDYVRPDSK